MSNLCANQLAAMRRTQVEIRKDVATGWTESGGLSAGIERHRVGDKYIAVRKDKQHHGTSKTASA